MSLPRRPRFFPPAAVVRRCASPGLIVGGVAALISGAGNLAYLAWGSAAGFRLSDTAEFWLRNGYMAFWLPAMFLSLARSYDLLAVQADELEQTILAREHFVARTQVVEAILMEATDRPEPEAQKVH